MSTSPLKISYLDNIVILTVLPESINARNAHWIKEEVLGFLRQKQPHGVLLNLHNVVHLGHVGLGALIAINNQLRRLECSAFLAPRPAIRELIQASQLEQVFQLWSPGDDCPICAQSSCTHLRDLGGRIQEFPAERFSDDQIPGLGEAYESTLARPLDLGDAHPVPPKGTSLMARIAMSALLLALVSGGTWLTAHKYFTQGGMPEGSRPSIETIMYKYDKNQDGELNQADLARMAPSERFYMSFEPYCTHLRIACATN